jgi:hypothetical protein
MFLQELTKMSQSLAACGHAPAQIHNIVCVSIIPGRRVTLSIHKVDGVVQAEEIETQ